VPQPPQLDPSLKSPQMALLHRSVGALAQILPGAVFYLLFGLLDQFSAVRQPENFCL
jgi:hypothetical protein